MPLLNNRSLDLPNSSLAETRVFQQFARATFSISAHAPPSPTAEKKPILPPLPQASHARDLKIQRLEVVLMLAREPLPSRKLAQFANLEDGSHARTVVRKLNELYDQSGSSFRVEEVAGGFQLLTRNKFATWLRRLGYVPPEVRLSSPTLETLAVVAYRQPVLKVDVEAIRGVNCGEILRQLMERDLVRISGRSEELGRPYLYSVTKRFLQLFGVRSLEDLPRAELIRAAPVPPVHKTASSAHHTSIANNVPHPQRPSDEKECDVSVMLSSKLADDEKLTRKFGVALAPGVRSEDEDDDLEDDDLDDDEDDDLDDEEDDLEDEEEEDDLDDEELDDEEWEEVDDEDDEEDDFDDEDDEDEDWDDDEEFDDDDDDEDDDWEDDEEEAAEGP